MPWLQTLARQISDRAGRRITQEQLLEELKVFRDQCRDPLLRRSYPADIHHFPRADEPRRATVDIILSFMDQQYPNIRIALISALTARLQKPRTPPEPGVVEKVLAKERYRRGISYWPLNRQRLREKYTGCYALLRIDSSNVLRAEPFALVERAADPTNLTVYWSCKDRVRVGELFVNSFRFCGVTLCQSTDAVIEPAMLTLLRAQRAMSAQHEKLPVVMGGFVVGWKDDDPNPLIQSRIAVVKLGGAVPTVVDLTTFESFVQLPNLADCLARLLQAPGVANTLYWQFLKKTEQELHPLDARNTFPGLSAGIVAI